MELQEFVNFAQSKIDPSRFRTDAAAHLITQLVPVAHPSETSQEVKKRIFLEIQAYQTINYIYVVDKNFRLKGVASVRDLLSVPDNTTIKELMNDQLLYGHPSTDRERIAQLAIKHNIKAVPVVGEENILLGVVPNDKIISILQEEQQEDMFHFSGILPGKKQKYNAGSMPVFTAAAHRSPWIILGILGGLLTAKVVGSFEATLENNLVLAGFIPLVAYVANAVGTQTQTLYIRDMVLGKIGIVGYTVRQLMITGMIGLVSWLLLVILGAVLWNSAVLGHVVGVSVMAAIMVATFFAMAIPFVLKKIGIDPAIGAGPFATIVQDLLSIILFLSIAARLLG